MVIPRVHLRVFFRREKPVVAKDVATDDDVPRAELLAVQETQVGLLGTNVPSFGVFGARVGIEADLPADSGERSCIGKARAHIDDPAQGRAAVQNT